MTVATPTDRPKSVPNHCVIEDFGNVFVMAPDFHMVPTDHDIPFSRTFQGLLRYIFKDFSLFFQTSIREKMINNGLFK